MLDKPFSVSTTYQHCSGLNGWLQYLYRLDRLDSLEVLNMLTLAYSYLRFSSTEQAKGSRQITSSIENISSMVGQLNASHKSQTKATERLTAATTKMETAIRDQDVAVKRLQDAVGKLR